MSNLSTGDAVEALTASNDRNRMRIYYIICMSPFGSHIRIRLFHHA